MDPVTAIFNFLSTPAGQQIAGRADDLLHAAIVDLIKKFNLRNPFPDAQASAPVPTVIIKPLQTLTGLGTTGKP